MSKKFFFFLPIVIILSVTVAMSGIKLFDNLQNSEKEESAKDIHYHAGFQVYIDGKLQDFSGNEYMHETPCTVDGKPVENSEHADEQLEKAHLHDHTGDVAHVHREGAVWGDLFTNIHYQFPKEKKIKVFAHGKEIESLEDYPIIPNDSVVILIGEYESPDEYLENSVTPEKIKEVEKKSETCST
jgi:hypothetical protein